jgi:molybdopterin converting factor small subunit
LAARVYFGSQFARLTSISTEAFTCDAPDLELAFIEVFSQYPLLRGYVLDEQNHLRQHVAVFVDGVLVHDRENWNQPLQPASQIYVLPALSGGLA